MRPILWCQAVPHARHLSATLLDHPLHLRRRPASSLPLH
uniref:Uncharacterized protein n=1 Tax=Arundo donax TaxID=35708 RepID=A0A0A9H020_ARUDO